MFSRVEKYGTLFQFTGTWAALFADKVLHWKKCLMMSLPISKWDEVNLQYLVSLRNGMFITSMVVLAYVIK